MEKRSCRKPGTVISSVRIQPPATALRSSTQTLLPLRASIAAQTSELMPLPTITTSNVSMSTSRSPGVRALDELSIDQQPELAHHLLLVHRLSAGGPKR